MKELNVWDYPKIYSTISIDIFLEMIKQGKIQSLNIERHFIPGDKSNSYLETFCNEKKISINYTNKDNPICIPTTPDIGLPSISLDCYNENKSKIKEAYLSYYKNTDKSFFIIYNYSFSQEILDILLEKNNTSLYFYDINFTDKQLKQIHSKLIDVYLNEKKINSEFLIGYISLSLAKFENSFLLNYNEIKDCNSNNFKYFKDNSIFTITNYEDNDEDKYLNSIFELLKKIDNLDKKFIFKITIKKRSKLEKYLKEYNLKNIKICIINDLYEYSYNEYIEEEKILDSIIMPIKKANLSPIEKFIAVYNIVKNFKPYKENNKDKEQSRYLRYILYNDYIVCVGFSNLLECLLDKVGIKAKRVGVEVDTSYDDGFNSNKPEEKVVDFSGHERVIVDIDDDKYNVHGLYMTDPTWDNDLNKDYLNHALMTFDNMIISRRMFKFSLDSPILTFHSFHEFSQQINYLLEKEIDNESKKNNKKENISVIINNSYFNTANKIIKNLECDKKIKYFKTLLNQCKNEIDFENFFTELGHYLLTRINNPIKKEIILKANDKVKKELNKDKIAQNEYDERDRFLFPYEVPNDNNHYLKAK